MFGTVRRYMGIERSLIDALAARSPDIRAALVAAPGARGCEVISTREGVIVVALGDDEASVSEVGRRFVAWVDRNLPELRSVTPEIWAGEVLVHAEGQSMQPGPVGLVPAVEGTPS